MNSSNKLTNFPGPMKKGAIANDQVPPQRYNNGNRQSTYVVFVTVRYYDTSYAVSVSFHVRKIRYYNINPWHIGIRKRKSAVENEHIVRTFKDCHILANLVETSERNNLYSCLSDFFLLYRGIFFGSYVVFCGSSFFVVTFLIRTFRSIFFRMGKFFPFVHYMTSLSDKW